MEVVSDYLFVLSPSDSIAKVVSDEKKMCFNRIGKFESMYSKAHITITNHFSKKNYEVEDLIPHLRNKVVKLPPINLYINNYNYFDNANGTKRTIYADIHMMDNEDIFFDQLRDMVNGRTEIVPHITIAKDLNYGQFEKLWPVFKNRQWEESFIADKLTILRRNELSDFNYENIAELKFKNDRLVMNYIYKNTRRRITPRGSMNVRQLGLFD